MKKSIRIDCTPLLSHHTGIGKYIAENVAILNDNNDYEWTYDYGGRLCTELANLEKEHTNDISVVTQSRSHQLKNQFKDQLRSFPRLFQILKRSYHAIKPSYNNIMNRFASIPIDKAYDLYWQPNYIVNPDIKTDKTIVTIHDFSFEEHPQWHPQERLDLFKQYFWKNIHQADKIICDSNYIKQCVIERLNIDEKDIEVIYLGIEHQVFKSYPAEQCKLIKEKFSLPARFILFVGSIEPRKNLINLLKAYHLLPEEEKNKTQLVLVGFKGWENQEIMQQIDAEKSHIKYLGYVSDSELAMIYNLATVFVYPSYYEGFGIPPLEAMACGCPVIVSNTTSMPEVCGDAALYVAPAQITDISDQLFELLQNTELQQQYQQKGLQHVQQFQWEKSAQQHLELFEQLLAK